MLAQLVAHLLAQIGRALAPRIEEERHVRVGERAGEVAEALPADRAVHERVRVGCMQLQRAVELGFRLEEHPPRRAEHQDSCGPREIGDEAERLAEIGRRLLLLPREHRHESTIVEEKGADLWGREIAQIDGVLAPRGSQLCAQLLVGDLGAAARELEVAARAAVVVADEEMVGSATPRSGSPARSARESATIEIERQ